MRGEEGPLRHRGGHKQRPRVLNRPRASRTVGEGWAGRGPEADKCDGARPWETSPTQPWALRVWASEQPKRTSVSDTESISLGFKSLPLPHLKLHSALGEKYTRSVDHVLCSVPWSFLQKCRGKRLELKFCQRY